MHQLLGPGMAAAALLAACGGDDERPAAATTEKKRPEKALVVSLGGTETAVYEGRSVTLTGDVTPASAQVGLYANPHPYKRWRLVRRLRTEDGRFRTRVRPRRNTRYMARARAGGQRSESGITHTEVIISGRVEVGLAPAGGTGRASVIWDAKVPLTVQRGARSCVYWRRGGEWRRVQCGAVERAGGGRLVASMRFVEPRAKPGDRFQGCSRLAVARGFGVPYVEGCGTRRLIGVS